MPDKSTYDEVVQALALGEAQVQEGEDWSSGWARRKPDGSPEAWGHYLAPPSESNSDFIELRMYRGKGNKVRFYAQDGTQYGPEQGNVGPAIAAAMSAGFRDLGEALQETAPHDYHCQDCGRKYSGGSQDPTCPDCGSKNSSVNPRKMGEAEGAGDWVYLYDRGAQVFLPDVQLVPSSGYLYEPIRGDTSHLAVLRADSQILLQGWVDTKDLGYAGVSAWISGTGWQPNSSINWKMSWESFRKMGEGSRFGDGDPSTQGIASWDEALAMAVGMASTGWEVKIGNAPVGTFCVLPAQDYGTSAWPAAYRWVATIEPFGTIAVPRVAQEGKRKPSGLVSLRETYQVNADVRKREYVKFISSGNTATVAGDVGTIPTLEAGVYGISTNMQGKAVFEKKAIRSDDILRFPDSRYTEVVREIDDFWAMHENFSELGLAHKRGVLMWGNPGTGKSILVKQVVEDAVNKGCVVFYPERLSELTEVLPQFRDVEPLRPCLVVLEDVDGLLDYGERYLLELFDGDAQVSNICYLATTNYPDRLPPRVMRSGRFDTKIEVKNPPREGRLAYFQHKLGGKISEDEIERIADITEDFSFAQLREFVVAAYAMRQEPKAAAARIRRNYTEGVSRVQRLVEGGSPMLRGARKARAAARGDSEGGSFLAILQAGEEARLAGLSIDACPYSEGDERREEWLDGYRDDFATESRQQEASGGDLLTCQECGHVSPATADGRCPLCGSLDRDKTKPVAMFGDPSLLTRSLVEKRSIPTCAREEVKKQFFERMRGSTTL